MKQKIKHILLIVMFVFYPCFLFPNNNTSVGIFKNNNSKNSTSNSLSTSLSGARSLAPGDPNDPNGSGDPALGEATPIEDNLSTLLFFVVMSSAFVIVHRKKRKNYK